MTAPRILLVIGGGIAAYKCLDLIRRLRERGMAVRVVMTAAAQEFVTPLSVAALSGDRVFSDLFDLDEEREIGHIRLSREADLIVVAPATANLLARMANGLASDLAAAVLLATDKAVLAAPAMNPRMWQHPATRRNVAQLANDGVRFVGPNSGEMAERGEAGVGRMADPMEIVAAVEGILRSSSSSPLGERAGVRGRPEPFTPTPGPSPQGGGEKTAQGGGAPSLAGRRVLVTSGPTHEPIDPVRYIANRSSGKQGHAIAAAAAALGADVTLISGPVTIADPSGVRVVRVVSARDMLEEVKAALPADIAIFAAAVADWRVANAASEKIKKGAKSAAPRLELAENPDILRTASTDPALPRPALVIGFAAETENVIEHAKKKRRSKGCDWIVANDVSPATGIMGGDRNSVHLVTAEGVDSWPEMSKVEVARELVARAAAHLAGIDKAPGP